MEVDEIQRQVCKFQRVSSNGSTTTTDNNNNSSIPQKLATSRTNFDLQNHDDSNNTGRGGTAIDAGGVARLSGWPSSRIVRVSRASGGKDRHSKVLTSKGLRDRRVRLSVGTAIQFYDLQDRLGFDQPSKAVEWLLKAAASSIDELPSLDLPFPGIIFNEKIVTGNSANNNMKAMIRAKSPSGSSTSETSKGSGLSLSRSENRIKARERARVNTASKKIESTGGRVMNPVNINVSETSSFTDLLTSGINTTGVRSPMEYFFNRPMQTSPQLFQIPQFNITNGDNLQQFSFVNDNLNFSMTSPSPSSSSGGGGVSPGGFTRGTLQSNLQSSFLPHPFQRYQSSSIDGSTTANLPFFVPNATGDYFPATGGYYGGGGDGGGRHSDHHKGKSKN